MDGEKYIKMEKVLILANGLDIGGLHGGAERFAVELVLGIRREGWPAGLALLAHTGSAVEQEWELRLREVGLWVTYLNPGTKRSLVATFRNTRSLVRGGRYGILHSHCKIGSVVAAGLRLGRWPRRALQTVHAGQEWGWGAGPWVLRQIFSQWIFGLALDAQVGVSEEITRRLRESPGARLSRQAVLRIPNALADEWFEPVPNRPPWNPNSGRAPVIGMVGVLTPMKGHAALIDALAAARSALPGLKLWIIGDGPERPRLEEQTCRLELESAVTFWGAHADVRGLLDQMDLFAFPSLSEGLPTVVLESMARGVPVVASDIPANRELVEDGVTGWLVPPGDAQQLAAAIQRALQNPEEMGTVAQQAYQKAAGFRFSAVIPAYLKLYRSLSG